MNVVFSKFLRKFLLVFFYDILIYSVALEDHVIHLERVPMTMRQQSLFEKKSKCYFGVEQVEYLDHMISKQGVATNPKKIMAVQQWPMLKTIKQLRGFLGLAGYYRRFVKGYGTFARPLTNMLKKNSFC